LKEPRQGRDDAGARYQYLDTLKEIGAQGKSNTVFVSHSPAAVGELFRQMQDAVMIGQNRRGGWK